MNEQIKATLENLMRRVAQQGNAPLAQDIARYLANPATGLPPAAAALLATELRAQNINITPQQLQAMTAPQGGGDTGGTALPDPQNGPALVNPGTGQSQSLAERVAQAAKGAAAAAAGGGQGGGGQGGGGVPVLSITPQQQKPDQSAAGFGGFSGAQGEALGNDDNQLVRFAMQAAGLDPDRLTHFSKEAGRALVPLVQARRAAFGLAGDGMQSVQGLPQDIASFAREFTTGGKDFFGNAQRYAQGAMGGTGFKNAIAGLGDQEQVAAMYQSLLPLLYAGANPLVQQAAGDTFKRQQNQFNDADFASLGSPGAARPGGGVFLDWLKQQQNADPITRRIFGF